MSQIFSHGKIAGERDVRVLELHGSASRESDVEFTLLERSLEDREPKYEAVSYCWGGQKLSQAVFSDGRALLVTENCLAALRRFRPASVGQSRLIWIDSICIDQNELLERNHQVKLMGEIYKCAEGVLIWLGDDNWPVNSLEDRETHEALVESFAWLVRLADAVAVEEHECKVDGILQLARCFPRGNFLEFVLRVPWFKRIWVIQECVLSKRATMVYRESQVPFNALLEAKDILVEHKGLGHPDATQAADALWNAFESHRMGMSLRKTPRSSGTLDDLTVCSFLAEVRFSKASESRDKVLALYELLTNYGVPIPEPDYSKSLATIYREATIVVIQCTGLRVLEQVDGLGSTPGLASWVPDWSSSKHSITFDCHLRCPQTPSTTPIFEFREDGRQLCVKGVVIDVITARSGLCYMHIDERIGDPMDYSSWTRNPPLVESDFKTTLGLLPQYSTACLQLWNLRTLRDFIDISLGGQPMVVGEPRILALYRCLMSQCNDTVPDEGKLLAWFRTLSEEWTHPEDQEPNAEWMFKYPSVLRKCADVPQLAWLTGTEEYRTLERIARSETCRAFHDGMGRIRYKTIFRTSSGKIGIAPWAIWPGDEIALISGVRVPLVLRRVGEHYKLIAHAYVGGSIHWEGWPKGISQLHDICLV